MEPRAKLAIIGAGGVLGAKLVERALTQVDGTVYAFSRGTTPAIPAALSPRVAWAPLDVANADAVMANLERTRPAIVINAAAMTNVDACEDHRDAALAANGAGPGHLARACVRLGAQLIHVSTDYVFPGDDADPGPYLEHALARPINYYGVTKLAGERAVQTVCGDRTPWLIARTALVYGQIPGGRTNFVRWLVGKLQSGERVSIVSDQYNTPTLADDLAAALLALAARGTRGLIHLAGPDLISREQWARAVAAYFGLDDRLIAVIATADLHQRAPRPLRSGLHTSRQDELVGVTLRGVQAGLAALHPE